MTKYLATLIILLSNTITFSQTITEERLEFELSDGFSNEKIIPLGEEGFILLAQEDGATKKESVWKVESYNTKLEKENTKLITLNEAKYLEKSTWDNSHFYGLFSNSRYRSAERKIIKINLKSLEFTEVNIELPKKFYLSEMSPLANELIFLGHIKKKIFCFSINAEIGTKNIIPIELKNPKKSFIENTDTVNNKSFVFINDWNKSEKKGESVVTVIDESGRKESSFVLNDNKDINLQNTSVSAGNDGDYFYTGTYSTKRRSSSTGIFFAKGTENNISFLKTYDYLTFTNFLNYLPEKKAKKIEKKKERKEKKGKEFSINYLMVGHDVMIFDTQYIYIGEAYYPTYRQESRTTVNSQGQTVTTWVTVFDGYQYTHAVIASFNKNGDLLWDHVVKMHLLYKPFVAKEFIRVQQKSNALVNLAYATGSSIKTLSVDLTGQINKEESFDIVETNIEGDKQKWTVSNLEYWYDRYFLMYGTQKIKNKTNDKIKRKRRVFFINKLKY